MAIPDMLWIPIICKTRYSALLLQTMWLPSKKSVPACTQGIASWMRATREHCSSGGMLSPATNKFDSATQATRKSSSSVRSVGARE